MSMYGEERTKAEAGGRRLVKESEREATNINHIVERWRRTGVVEIPGRPQFGDFSDSISFHECQDRVAQARQAFMALPSSVRRICDNDPGRFLDLAYTEEGRELLADAGMPDLVVKGEEHSKEPPVVDPPAGDPTGNTPEAP